jgi:hypothetical protein
MPLVHCSAVSSGENPDTSELKTFKLVACFWPSLIYSSTLKTETVAPPKRRDISIFFLQKYNTTMPHSS